MKKSKKGFTLIELLVVLSIISLLSAVILSALNSARIKGRDGKRARETQQLFLALQLFYDRYGCLPTTSGSTCWPTYSESNAGAWDYSSQGGFVQFLKDAAFVGKSPVDPKNDMTGDSSPSGSYAYRYYCYTSPLGGIASNGTGLHLGYWKESDGSYVQVSRGQTWADPDFVCR